MAGQTPNEKNSNGQKPFWLGAYPPAANASRWRQNKDELRMGRKEGPTKYIFIERTGDIVNPLGSEAPQDIVAIRHSANIEPWKDNDVHLHRNSEEFYFLRAGR